ncbi:MAG: DinB family protein [Ginsengibacter sp.]
MTTDTVHTTELFASLDETWADLLNLITSTDATLINAIPFEDSWTAAQLATHVTKSNKAIAQGMNMKGKPAERDPEKGVPDIKKMFLDFTTKYQSPEFIVPEKGNYNKETVIEKFKKSIDQLQDTRTEVNLSEIINLPIFGEVTKLELLHFVLYHTQRHHHQLKRIIKGLKKSKAHE